MSGVRRPLERALTLLLIAAAIVAAIGVAVRVFQPRFAFFPNRGEQASPAGFGISFTPATIDTADGERLHAWYLPASNARAFVLYFHGNGGNLSVWLPILAGIQRRGYAVAAIDYRGYGLSTGHPSEKGLYRDVDAALAWVNRVAPARVPVVYWGRSLGTTMAAYAATRQKPDALILESGFPDARSLTRGTPVLTFFGLFSTYAFPTAEYGSRAGCPILVMHGDRDSVVPFTLGRELFETLPAPKRFETIGGADHNDLAPPDARAYWRTVDTFIAQLPR